MYIAQTLVKGLLRDITMERGASPVLVFFPLRDAKTDGDRGGTATRRSSSSFEGGNHALDRVEIPRDMATDESTVIIRPHLFRCIMVQRRHEVGSAW